MPVTTRSRSRRGNEACVDLPSPIDDIPSTNTSTKPTKPKRDTSTITREECETWRDSKINKGSILNPLSKSFIKVNGELNKEIEKQCNLKYDIKKKLGFEDSLKNSESLDDFESWIRDPTINPFDNTSKIDLKFNKKSKYFKIYMKVFKLFRENKKGGNNIDEEILKIIPKNHLLFEGKVDLLYLYFKLEENDGNNNNNMTYKGDNKFSNGTYDNILIPVLEELNEYDKSEFIKFYGKFIYDSLLLTDDEFINEFIFKDGLESINGYNEYNDHIENLNNKKMNFDNMVEICNNLKIYDEIEDKLSLLMNINKEKFIQDSDSSKYFFVHYENIFKDIYDITYYNKSRHYDVDKFFKKIESTYLKGKEIEKVISNPLNYEFKLMDDPLENILIENKSKKPIQNYTNKDFLKYSEDYKKLKNEFDVLSKNYKSKSLENNLSPPKRPTMKIGDKQITIGVHKINQNYTDEDFEKKLIEYESKKHLLNEYQKLIETGFLSLTSNKSNGIIPQRLNKSREIIRNEDLNEDPNIKTTCNGNLDVLTREHLNVKEYPLAKLQLLAKIHTRKKNTLEKNEYDIIRTDCFYAPNLYNLLINQVKDKQSFHNIITKNKIDEEDIDELMKIINFIDPSLPKPQYIKPIHDIKLEITQSSISYKGKEFYKIFIQRRFGNLIYKVYDICSILADIEHDETGSTDMTSSTLMFKIFKLFNDGKLLETYVPPYNKNGSYSRLMIHFNNFKHPSAWIYKYNPANTDYDVEKSRDEQIEMFLSYYNEVNGFL